MALKRLPESRRIKMDPVKVYLEDLEDVYEIVGDGGARVRIQVGNRIADAIDDLTQLPQDRIESIELIRTDERDFPEVRVEISTISQGVWIGRENDNAMRGLAHTVARVLERKRRRGAGVVSHPATPVVVAVLSLAVATAFAGLLIWLGVEPSFASGLLLVLCVAFGGPVTLLLFRADQSLVLARRRADSPGFFRRNRDSLWMLILSSLASALVGFVLGKLT